MNVPRIRIEEIDDICVLICYLIYSLGCPLSKQQLLEITSLEDAVNYFAFDEAFAKAEAHLIEKIETDGELFYGNSSAGIKAARELGATLPLSIRDKMFKEAVRVYTRDAMHRTGSSVSVRYIKNADGSCTVGVTVMDTISATQKYYLSVVVPNEEKADLYKKKITENPRAFAKYLDDYFIRTGE